MTRSPYIVEKTSVSIVMLKVLLALLPGIAAYVWIYGSGLRDPRYLDGWLAAS